MDAVIVEPSPDRLKVLPHNQYAATDSLTPSSVPPNPLDLFHSWFKDAVDAAVREPEAMALSTSTISAVPSVRIVLFKALDPRGFIFFTNYTSRKSHELTENPNAALAFYWAELYRSVRVVGRAERLERSESEAYFQSRPVGSQLGAWASRQSSVIEGGDLETRVKKLEARFAVHESETPNVPTPEFWGGWRIVPHEVEFWSGKPSRLHDRVRYLRTESFSDNAMQWKIDKLAP